MVDICSDVAGVYTGWLIIMIDLSGLPVGLRIVLLIVPFVLLIIGIAINAYIAGSRHFNVMCHAFGRSSGLDDEIAVWGTRNLKSRMLIVSIMSLGVIWPSFGHRCGWLSIKDSDEFPIYLKWRMKLSSYCLLAGLGGLFFLTTFVKIIES